MTHNIGAIYIMLLASDKPVEVILNGYNIKLPFSEIHAAVTYLIKRHFVFEEVEHILNENIDFLSKYLI